MCNEVSEVQSGNLLYSHFFFTLTSFRVGQVSRLLCFAKRPRHCEVIQFVGGLHVTDGDLVRGLILLKNKWCEVITYGVNDCAAGST